MWLYFIGAFMVMFAVVSIRRTQGLYKKYDTKLAELNEKTKNGYYPQVEIDQIIEEFIEDFKEENIDAIMYTQMSEGIKNGSLAVAGAEGIVMLSEEEYERLVKCDELIKTMNDVAKKKDVVN